MWDNVTGTTCTSEGKERGHPKCVQVHSGVERYHASRVPTHLQALIVIAVVTVI